jgi:preprotein translocase subunit YajC
MPAMGYMILATSSTKSTPSSTNYLPILLIIVVLVGIYWTMSRRNRARQATQMNTAMVPGQPVRTTSGMYGTISSVEGDDVMVEVHPGVHIRMMKRAVVPVADGASTNGMRTGTTTTAADTGDDGTSAGSTNGSGPDHETSDDEADADDFNPKDRNF